MTNVTIFLFETTFRQTSLSFKQIFLVEDQKTLTLSEDHDKKASNSPVTFVTPKRFSGLLLWRAVLLLNLTNVLCDTRQFLKIMDLY